MPQCFNNVQLCPGISVHSWRLSHPIKKGCEWHILSHSALLRALWQFSPLEGIAATETRAEGFFWPETIELGSLLLGDCISSWDHRQPSCTLGWITSTMALCRVLEQMTGFITDHHKIGSMIFRDNRQVILVICLLSPVSAPSKSWPQRDGEMARDQSWSSGSSPFWHLEFKQVL